jgi:hypothetical protein
VAVAQQLNVARHQGLQVGPDDLGLLHLVEHIEEHGAHVRLETGKLVLQQQVHADAQHVGKVF